MEHNNGGLEDDFPLPMGEFFGFHDNFRGRLVILVAAKELFFSTQDLMNGGIFSRFFR